MFDLLSFLAVVLLVIIVVMLVNNNESPSNNRRPAHPHKQYVPPRLSNLYYHRPHHKPVPSSHNNGWQVKSDQYRASLNYS